MSDKWFNAKGCLKSTLEKVLKCLHDAYPKELRVIEVEEATKLSKATAQRACSLLSYEGYVKRNGWGVYAEQEGGYEKFKQISRKGKFIHNNTYHIELEHINKYCNNIARGIKNRDNLSTITGEDIYNIYLKQDGRCVISNVLMTTIVNQGWRIPTNISVDRIDSRKPYSLDNIQLVCVHVNIMKADLDESELVIFCKLIYQHYLKRLNQENLDIRTNKDKEYQKKSNKKKNGKNTNNNSYFKKRINTLWQL